MSTNDPRKLLDALVKKTGQPMSKEQQERIVEKYDGKWGDFLDAYAKKIGEPMSAEQRQRILEKYELVQQTGEKKKESGQPSLDGSQESFPEKGIDDFRKSYEEFSDQKVAEMGEAGARLKEEPAVEPPLTQKEAVRLDLERIKESGFPEYPSSQTAYTLDKVGESVKALSDEYKSVEARTQSMLNEYEKLSNDPDVQSFFQSNREAKEITSTLAPVQQEIQKIDKLIAEARKKNDLSSEKELMGQYNQLAEQYNEIINSPAYADAISKAQDTKLRERAEKVFDLQNNINSSISEAKILYSKLEAGHNDYSSLVEQFNNTIGAVSQLRASAIPIPQQPNEKLPTEQELQARSQDILRQMKEGTLTPMMPELKDEVNALKSASDNELKLFSKDLAKKFNAQVNKSIPYSVTEMVTLGIEDPSEAFTNLKLYSAFHGRDIELVNTTLLLNSLLNTGRQIAAIPADLPTGFIAPLALLSRGSAHVLRAAGILDDDGVREASSFYDMQIAAWSRASHAIKGTPLPGFEYKEMGNRDSLINNAAYATGWLLDGALGFLPTLITGASATGLLSKMGQVSNIASKSALIGFIPQIIGMETSENLSAIVAAKNNGDLSDFDFWYQAQKEAPVINNIVAGLAMGALEQISYGSFSKFANQLSMQKGFLPFMVSSLESFARQGPINWVEAGITVGNQEYVQLGIDKPDMSESERQALAYEAMGSFMFSDEGIGAGIQAGLSSIIIGGASKISNLVTPKDKRPKGRPVYLPNSDVAVDSQELYDIRTKGVYALESMLKDADKIWENEDVRGVMVDFIQKRIDVLKNPSLKAIAEDDVIDKMLQPEFILNSPEKVGAGPTEYILLPLEGPGIKYVSEEFESQEEADKVAEKLNTQYEGTRTFEVFENDGKFGILQTKQTLEETQIEKVDGEQQSGEGAGAATTFTGVGSREYQEKAPTHKVGRTVTRTLTNGAKLRGRYKIVSASEPMTSHNEKTFAKNEGFPTNEDGSTINNRDYENSKSNKEQVLTIGDNYDGRAIEFTPSVTEEGFVIDGTNRIMSRKIAAEKGTDAKYLESLKERAEMYGFSAADVDAVPNPTLVFEVEGGIQYTTKMMAQFNAQDKKSESPTEVAVAISKMITDAIRRKLFNILSDVEVMSDLTSKPKKAQEFKRLLIGEELIQPNEVPRYFDVEKGVATAEGVSLAQSVLLGTTLSEKSIRTLSLEGMGDIKNKVIRAIVDLSENSTKGENSLIKEIERGLELLYKAKQAKVPVSKIVNQLDAFGDNRWTPAEFLMATYLEGKGFKEFLRDSYNPRVGLADLFSEGIVTKDDIINEVIGTVIPNIDKYMQFLDTGVKSESKASATEQAKPEASKEGVTQKQGKDEKVKTKAETEAKAKAEVLGENEGVATAAPDLKAIGEVAKKTGISPKNLRDLYKVNRELFGLDRLKALSAAVVMDMMIGAMARVKGVSKADIYKTLEFRDGEGIGEEQLKNQGALFQGTVNGKKVQLRRVSADVVNGFYSPIEQIINDTKFSEQNTSLRAELNKVQGQLQQLFKDKKGNTDEANNLKKQVTQLKEQISKSETKTDDFSLSVADWKVKFGNSEEANWTGLTDWLNQQQGSVSKADIQNYLKENRIQIVEVVKGEITNVVKSDVKSVRFKDFGSGSYVVEFKDSDLGSIEITAQEADSEAEAIEQALDRANYDNSGKIEQKTKFSQYVLEGEKESYKEIMIVLPREGSMKKVGDYTVPSAHQYGEDLADNRRVVHLRMNTRTDAQGNKVLFLEEVQSDWGQKGKKEGFANEKIIEEREKLRVLVQNKKDKVRVVEDKIKNLKPLTEEEQTKIKREIRKLEELRNEVRNNRDWEALGVEIAEREDALSEYENTKNILKSEIYELKYSDVDSVTTLEENLYEFDRKNSTEGIPTAPFVTDTSAWVKLGLKVALKEAIAQGATKIAWSTGTQQFERWGSEKIDWAKIPVSNYEIRKDSLSGEWVVTVDAMGVDGKNKASLRIGFPTEQEAKDYASKGSYQVSIKEQVSGTAFDGMNIDEKALSSSGVTITSKEDLRKAIKKNLSRERNDAEIDKLTDRIWKRMQTEDSGTSLPRKEGMEGFYGNPTDVDLVEVKQSDSQNPSFEGMIDFNLDGGVLEIGKVKGAKVYSVLHLKVEENKRRQGIALALLQRALNETKGELSGQASNDMAVSLNYKLGMRATDKNGKEMSLAETKKTRAEGAGESIGMILPENKRGSNYKPFGSIGIVGGVAEKLFGQRVGTVEIGLGRSNQTPNTVNKLGRKIDEKTAIQKISEGTHVYTHEKGDIFRLYDANDVREALKSGFELYTRDNKDISTQHSIDITPEMRMQALEGLPLFQGNQGAMLAQDGRFIIYALTNPNVSTPLHELAHVFEHYLTDAQRSTVLKWANSKEWDVSVSEKFARGFERFLAEGKAPNSALQKIFNKFKDWLTDIYGKLVESEIGLQLNAPMRELYAQMLGESFQDKSDLASDLGKTSEDVPIMPQPKEVSPMQGATIGQSTETTTSKTVKDATGEKGPGTAKAKGERPVLTEYGKDIAPEYRDATPDRDKAKLTQHQQDGVNAMLGALGSGKKGFILADGAGAGKTRQILSAARALAEKGKRVIIVTESKSIIAGSFQADSNALGMAFKLDARGNAISSGVEIVTVNHFRDKVDPNSYDIAFLDEAQKFSGLTSKTGKVLSGFKGQVVYSSATPFDTIDKLLYILPRMLNMTQQQFLSSVGAAIIQRPGRGAEVAFENGDTSRLINLLNSLHTRFISEGTMVHRRYDFFGNEDLEFTVTGVDHFPKGRGLSLEEAEQGIRDFYAKKSRNVLITPQEERRGVTIEEKRRQINEQKVNELNALTETYKATPELADEVERIIKEGGQVVMYGNKISGELSFHYADSAESGEASGPSFEYTRPSFIEQMSQMLKARGVNFEVITGENKDKAATVDRFQEGKTKVLLINQTGTTGINLNDSVGNSPRTLFIAGTLPNAIQLDQLKGRVSRLNNASKANVIYVNANSEQEKANREKRQQKVGLMNSLLTGEQIEVMDNGTEIRGTSEKQDVKLDTEADAGPFTFEAISEKAFIVKGTDFSHKDLFKNINGRWNKTHRAWMFPNQRAEEVRAAIKDYFENRTEADDIDSSLREPKKRPAGRRRSRFFNGNSTQQGVLNLIGRLSKSFPNITVSTDKDSFDQAASLAGYIGEAPIAFVFEGAIYFDISRATPESAVEEFAHLWVGILKQVNKPLYDKMAKESMGTEVFNEVANDPNYGAENMDLRIEETLSKLITDKYMSRRSGLAEFADRIWKAVIQSLNWLSKKTGLNFINTPLTNKYINVNKMSLDSFLRTAAKELYNEVPLSTLSSVGVVEFMDNRISGNVYFSNSILHQPDPGRKGLYNWLMQKADRYLTPSGVVGKVGKSIIEGKRDKLNAKMRQHTKLIESLFKVEVPKYFEDNGISDLSEKKEFLNLINDVFTGNASITALPASMRPLMERAIDAKRAMQKEILLALEQSGQVIVNENLTIMFVENLRDRDTLESVDDVIYQSGAELAERVKLADEAQLELIAEELAESFYRVQVSHLRMKTSINRSKTDFLDKVKGNDNAYITSLTLKLEKLLAQSIALNKKRHQVELNKEDAELRRQVLNEYRKAANQALETKVNEAKAQNVEQQERILELKRMLAFVQDSLIDARDSMEQGVTKEGLLRQVDILTRARIRAEEAKASLGHPIGYGYKYNPETKTFDVEVFRKGVSSVKAEGLTANDMFLLLGNSSLVSDAVARGEGYMAVTDRASLVGNTLYTRMHLQGDDYIRTSYLAHEMEDYRERVKEFLGPEGMRIARDWIRKRIESSVISQVIKEGTPDGGYEYTFVNEYGIKSGPYTFDNVTEDLLALGARLEDIKFLLDMQSGTAEFVQFGRYTNFSGNKGYIEFKAREVDIDSQLDALIPRPDSDATTRKHGSVSNGTRHDLSPLMKKRRDMPSELKMLLGEITDPAIAISDTLTRMENLVQSHHFINKILQNFSGQIQVITEANKTDSRYADRKASNWKEVPRAFAPFIIPIGGRMYMDPVLYEEFFGSDADSNSGLFKVLLTLSGLSKLMLTAASPGGHGRNYVGNVKIMASSGNYKAVSYVPMMTAIVRANLDSGSKGFFTLFNLPSTYTVAVALGTAKVISNAFGSEKLKAAMKAVDKGDKVINDFDSLQDLLNDKETMENIAKFMEEQGFMKGAVGGYNLERMIELYDSNSLHGMQGAIDLSDGTVKGVVKKAARSIGKVVKGMSDSYQAGDAAMKFSVWLEEFDSYSEYYKKQGRSDWAEAAMEKAKENTVALTPNYNYSPKFFQNLSVSPAIGMFILFRAEFIRNLANTYILGLEEIKSGDKKLMIKGAIRMASASTMPTISAFAIKYGIGLGLGLLGFDDEDEVMEAIQMGLSKYFRDNSVLPIKKNGSMVTFVDLTYMDVHSELSQMYMLASRGKYKDAVLLGTKGFYATDASTEATIKTMSALLSLTDNNSAIPTDDFGRQLYNETDDALSRMIKISMAGAAQYNPVFAKNLYDIGTGGLQKLHMSAMSERERDEYRKNLKAKGTYEKDPLGIISNWAFGLRARTVDLKQGYSQRVSEWSIQNKNLEQSVRDLPGFKPDSYFRKKDALYQDLSRMFSMYGTIASEKPFDSKENKAERAKLMNTIKGAWYINVNTDVLKYSANSLPAPARHFQIGNAPLRLMEINFPEKHKRFIDIMNERGFSPVITRKESLFSGE